MAEKVIELDKGKVYNERTSDTYQVNGFCIDGSKTQLFIHM